MLELIKKYGKNFKVSFSISGLAIEQLSLIHILYKIENGNWGLDLPLDRLRHGMKYRLWVEWKGGEGERLPSHVRRAVQDLSLIHI